MGIHVGLVYEYRRKKIEFQMILFYDGPKPPDGLYHDLLNIPNSDKAVIESDFLKFLLSIAIPLRER